VSEHNSLEPGVANRRALALQHRLRGAAAATKRLGISACVRLWDGSPRNGKARRKRYRQLAPARTHTSFGAGPVVALLRHDEMRALGGRFQSGNRHSRRPLLKRKANLAKLLRRAPQRLVYSDHWCGDGRELFRKVRELGGEGIVSKRADAAYTSGPSSTWLKCKHASVGTFPVVGYVPDGKRIESLLVAEASTRGLRPVGRVEFRMPGVLDDDHVRRWRSSPGPCRAFACAPVAVSAGSSRD
jgi:hypothetical protein